MKRDFLSESEWPFQKKKIPHTFHVKKKAVAVKPGSSQILLFLYFPESKITTSFKRDLCTYMLASSSSLSTINTWIRKVVKLRGKMESIFPSLQLCLFSLSLSLSLAPGNKRWELPSNRRRTGRGGRGGEYKSFLLPPPPLSTYTHGHTRTYSGRVAKRATSKT